MGERVALPRLLELTDALVTHEAVGADLRDLVAAGGSLGGARPKAVVVLDDGAALSIAKLPRRGSDEWDAMGWEKVTLDLDLAARLTVPRSHLVQVLGRNVLITERFDRRGALRVAFVSAMTMLEARDGDQRSYLEIADSIEFDTDRAPSASIERALETSQMYRLSPTRAIEIVDEVEQATATWRTVATRLELPSRELELMVAAFDTPERRAARAIATAHRTSTRPEGSSGS